MGVIISFGLGFAVGVIAGAIGAICTLVVIAAQERKIKEAEDTYGDEEGTV